MNKLRNKNKQGVFGSSKERVRETQSSKRFTTDPELIMEYAGKCDVTFMDAKFLLNEFVNSIRDIVKKNGTVTIRKLGTFHLGITKRSKMFVPRTGDEIKIP